MARTVRNLPVNYPQPLATQILKAEGHRQASMLRQEIVTDLLGVLNEAREPGTRVRLLKLIESNLKSGMTAAEKAEELWPTLQDVREVLTADTEAKPAATRKHLTLFEQFDKVHHRSLELLKSSFEHIHVILDRLQPPEPEDFSSPAKRGN
jgi:hypothetical protein